MKSLRTLGLLIISAISIINGYAREDVVAMLDSAVKAYDAGEYLKSAQFYEMVADSAGVSSQLYANMGNAYTKAGDYGHALICYERSLYLDPSDREVRNNRAYIMSKIEDGNKANAKGKKISVAEEDKSFFSKAGDFIKHSHQSDTWAIWGGICFILLCGCVGVYIFRSEILLRKIGFFGGIGLASLTVVFMWFAFASAKAYEVHDRGVVMGYKVMLLSEPFVSSKASSIPLERGTCLTIMETDNGKDGSPAWYKVRLNSDIIGWIKAEEFEVI